MATFAQKSFQRRHIGISEDEKSEMQPHVRDAEPALALFVPDGKPLMFYEYIVRLAKEGLAEGGTLYLEINRRFGTEVKQLLENSGFKEVEISRDLHGNERFVIAKRNSN